MLSPVKIPAKRPKPGVQPKVRKHIVNPEVYSNNALRLHQPPMINGQSMMLAQSTTTEPYSFAASKNLVADHI